MTDYKNKGSSYVTAPESVDYLAQHVGGRYQARTLIIDAMHSGDLTTTCDTLWTINKANPTDEWERITRMGKVFAKNVELPADYWHGSHQWPAETRHWRWNEGNFLLDRGENPADIFWGDALENVWFEETQLERLIGKSSRAGVGGRKFDKERWADFWLNIIY